MRGWRVLLFSGVVLTIRGAELMPDAMMCELLAKPGRVAVTDATPELSWGFKGGEPGDYQTAYRIQVAKTTEQLTTNTPDLWDSGRVASDRSLYVSYAGKPLMPGGKVYWRVRVWDKRQQESCWSPVKEITLAEKLGPDTVLRYPVVQEQVKPVCVTTNKQGHVFVDFGKAAFGGLEWIPPAGSDAGPLVVHLGEKAKGHLVKICG